MMQGLELPAPPLLAATELPPAHDQPLSPPTPPGTAHELPEPQLQDTTGQARRRATTGLSTHMGSSSPVQGSLCLCSHQLQYH